MARNTLQRLCDTIVRNHLGSPIGGVVEDSDTPSEGTYQASKRPEEFELDVGSTLTLEPLPYRK